MQIYFVIMVKKTNITFRNHTFFLFLYNFVLVRMENSNNPFTLIDNYRFVKRKT